MFCTFKPCIVLWGGCVHKNRQTISRKIQEHFHDYKNTKNKSKLAQYQLDNKHSIGPIENIMSVIHIMSEGIMLDTMEKFYIYKET